jgi:hypothetical protein
MKIRNKAINFMVVTAFMLLMPSCVLGEWFGDIYLGMHSSKADDMSIKFNGATVKRFSPSFDSGAPGGTISLEPTLKTHNFSLGVSFRF